MSNHEAQGLLRHRLAEYLAGVSRKMHTQLKLGSNGICLLKHDASGLEIAIELPEYSDMLYFYSPVCRVPYEHTEQFFEKILESNLHGIATRQASFGLDAKTQNIVLSYSISMRHVDAISFCNILFNFIKTAERVHYKILHWIEMASKQHMLSGEEADAMDHAVLKKNIKLRV